MKDRRYSYEDLLVMSKGLLLTQGMSDEAAEATSEILVEADLMGHITHGLTLLPVYIDELKAGRMKPEGSPVIVSDKGSAVVWDGEYLSGIYLTRSAVTEALERSQKYPVVTYALRRAHHIACLAAYMPQIVENGRIGILMASDPAAALVAPFGGRSPVYSPNPIAAGIPSGPDGPIILDISTSTTAAGVVNRYQKAGKHLPGEWMLTADGKPSNDPSTLTSGGSILPLGGLDAGYKGFALGLLIEALTSGLAGFGRADKPNNWGTSVYLQIINPECFGGLRAFERETGWLKEVSKKCRPRPGYTEVRTPGDRALALKAEQMEKGVWMESGLIEVLSQRCRSSGIQFPVAF